MPNYKRNQRFEICVKYETLYLKGKYALFVKQKWTFEFQNVKKDFIVQTTKFPWKMNPFLKKPHHSKIIAKSITQISPKSQ